MRLDTEFSIASFCLLFGLAVSGCGFKNYKNDPGESPGKSANANIEPQFDPNGPAATFAQIDAKIIQPKCIKCHKADDKFPLTSYDAIATNSKILTAGDPEKSKLYTEVETGKMPRKAPNLSPEEVGMIYTWIKSGAQDDGAPSTL